MNAGVRATGARNLDRLAKEPGKRGFQLARNGSYRRLPLEAAKAGAVVLDGEAKRG